MQKLPKMRQIIPLILQQILISAFASKVEKNIKNLKQKIIVVVVNKETYIYKMTTKIFTWF